MRLRELMFVIAGVAVGMFFWATAQPGTAQESQYRAPRLAGTTRPDLNGLWQAFNTANWDIQDHSAQPGPFPQLLGAWGAQPPGVGVVDGNEIPYRPEALARKKANFERRTVVNPEDLHGSGDPEAKCYLPGVPRATYLPFPFQIVQSTNRILMSYQFASAARTIPLTKPTEPPVDFWMGWSHGRWEGDTLVVDVTGFNGFSWFDRAGNFASEQLHVVERYTPTSPHHLMYEATIEDPQVFTRPWKMSMPLYRRIGKDANLLDFKCIDLVEEFIYGTLRKPVSK
jgi:hypothetical protein